MKVALCWHMHQPEYRNLRSGTFHLPWTYLHAIKDYVDMAAHIEAVPGARAVVNFAPILLEQLEDYVSQLQQFLGFVIFSFIISYYLFLLIIKTFVLNLSLVTLTI